MSATSHHDGEEEQEQNLLQGPARPVNEGDEDLLLGEHTAAEDDNAEEQRLFASVRQQLQECEEARSDLEGRTRALTAEVQKWKAQAEGLAKYKDKARALRTRWEDARQIIGRDETKEESRVAVQCCVSFAGRTGRRKRPLYRLQFFTVVQSSVTDDSHWPAETMARELQFLNNDVTVGATKDNRYKPLAFSVKGIEIESCDSPWCDKAPIARITPLLQHFNVTVLKISTDYKADLAMKNNKWNNLYCTIIKCLEHNNIHHEIHRLLIRPRADFSVNWMRGIRTRRKIRKLQCTVLFDRSTISRSSPNAAIRQAILFSGYLSTLYSWREYLLLPLSRVLTVIRGLLSQVEYVNANTSLDYQFYVEMLKRIGIFMELEYTQYPLLPAYYVDDCFVSEEEAHFAIRPDSLAFYDPTPFSQSVDRYNF